MTMFTDAERSFADSAEGKHAIAMARHHHDVREGHKGVNARPWTDAMQAEAIQAGARTHARANLQRAHDAITAPRERATADAARVTDYVTRKEQTAKAWQR